MVTDNTSDSKWTLLGKNADINSQAPNIVLSPGHTRGNLEKCKKDCIAQTNCAGFTYDHRENPGICWLKNKADSIVPAQERDSYRYNPRYHPTLKTVTLTTEEKKQANTHYICPKDCMYATCGHNLDRFPGDKGAKNVGSANGSACKVGYNIWCDNRRCPPKYSCNNYTCSKDSNGKYTTLEACTDVCEPKYSCNNYTCSEDPNGKYKTLDDCNNACIAKYTCDKNTWEIKKDPNGEYRTLHEAYLNCKKPPLRYSCDKNTWEIKEDQNGEYATPEEADLNCKSPLIIPKQNVTQEMLDNENKITSNIDGHIQSHFNKLQSSYLHMIVWGAVSILVIFMLFYYTTNRSDNILKTLISILICLVIIWVVASWFYNYFYRNSISFFSTPQIF
tara:strand:- start:613 stop:1782 length:1170 start_codon:yes stop_codon:yes gene_type:complete